MPAKVRNTPTVNIRMLGVKNTRSNPTNVMAIDRSRDFFRPNYSVNIVKIANPITAPRNPTDCTVVS
jgi:hypothetical protein